MSGLVFKDSVSIYQDQAKIMFDYYKRAAEQIVQEEMRIEELIKTAKNELNAMEIDYPLAIANQEKNIKNKTILGYVLLVVLVGIGILIWVNTKLKKALAELREEAEIAIGNKKQQIDELEKEHANIRRDYKIDKLGVVYVPVASHIPFEDKNFVLDYTGSVPEMSFTLSALKQPEAIKENVVDLKNLIETVPLVETSDDVEVVDTSDYSTSMQEAPLYDFMGSIDRHMRNLGYMLGDVNRVSVSLPIVPPESKEMEFLMKHGTADTGNSPICPIFDLQAHDANIKSFEKLNDMKKGLEVSSDEFSVFIKDLMKQLAESAQVLTQMKVSCSNKVLQYSNSIFMNALRTSFNHYSPLLEADEIERIRTANFNFQDAVGDYTPFTLNPSSRMRYDLVSNNWVAEDNSRSSFPFGMHQIHEEVMMPVIYNLMEETRIERLKIYNHIKDQKLDYLNQWHRDTEDFYGRNRAESNDIINRMRETFAEYSSALNTLKALQETEKQMGSSKSLDSTKVIAKSNQAETLATFELQGQQFMKQQEEFMEYMERLKEDIDAQAEKFGFIEYFEASLRDNEARQIAMAAEDVQNIDPRRKVLVGAGAHIASLSDIPPVPQIEEKAHDDFTINLIQMADNALKSLDSDELPVEESEPAVGEEPGEVEVGEELEDQSVAAPAEEPEQSAPETGATVPPEAPAPEPQPSAEQPVGDQTYCLVIDNLGDKAETALFVISDILNIDVEEVRNMLSELPTVLVHGLTMEDATAIRDEILTTGASAVIKGEE